MDRWERAIVGLFLVTLIIVMFYALSVENIAKAGKCGNPFHIEACAK